MFNSTVRGPEVFCQGAVGLFKRVDIGQKIDREPK